MHPSTKFPKISVVTPCFNSQHTIRETLESVLQQNYPNFEHIVIDGGSQDGTLSIIRDFPHLIWESQKDEGHYHAMNKGIERATGDVVVILNADDCYRPGAFQTVGQAFLDHPDWDGLFGDIIYVDGGSKEIYRRVEAKFDYNILRFSIDYVIHPTLFVKKAVYNRLGLFRHRQYLNCCDYEFILRLGKERCTIGHVPFFLVNYRYHQHGQSADLRVTRNMAKESARIQDEYGCPRGALRPIVKNVYRVKRQWQKLIHRGTVDFIPGHWKTKSHMQAKTEFSSNIGVDKLEV
jgi:glycosyltransferase involved in cell wall biosynthesis